MDIQTVTSRLYSLYSQNRLGHAYILTGSDMATCVAAAKSVLAVLFCSEAGASGAACGTCVGCLSLANGNHVGVAWLQPDGASLKIAQMRTAMRQDTRMISGVSLQVAVLEQAHKLTIEATNAMLKWVEEPGEHRLFLFLTTSPASMLATLRSRCVQLRVEETSLEAGAVDPAFLWAPLKSADDPARFAESVELVLELGRYCAIGEQRAWHLVFDRIAKMNYSTDELATFVDALSAYFRDLAAIACGSQPLVFAERARAMEDIAVRRSASDFARCAVMTAGLRRRFPSHVSGVAALESLAITLVDEAFRAREAGGGSS